MSALTQLANGASALAIGGYLAAVVYQGNVKPLISEMSGDYGYIEFLVAGVILKVIVDNPATHEVATLLIVAAVIAATLKFAAGSGNLSALENFANGNASMLATLEAIFTT